MDTCYNIVDSWKHYASLKEDMKDYIVYESIYMKTSVIGKYIEMKLVAWG